MKTFAVLAVGLALLCAVSAQDVITTVYAGPNCAGPLATNQQPNPIIQKVGVCIPSNRSMPDKGSKIISCDGKTFTVRIFLNDDSKNTSSCLRPDPDERAKDQVVSLNFCYNSESGDGGTGRSGMYTLTTLRLAQGQRSPLDHPPPSDSSLSRYVSHHLLQR